ncbi:hypothetical protein SAMN02745746_01045 [Pseudogulbenkiania subflava DSM 22618]|uniref:Uncharacterized protein n=1 Tax=Pseudogulbenkiania subflava DSM 22618 TaxID=1123014 RepID=A0A1Y6BL14_9NEIS|nr:hypothetical protein SAMN02745746_01045 [Pseudogulbenkiania subflava DSM 22618]
MTENPSVKRSRIIFISNRPDDSDRRRLALSVRPHPVGGAGHPGTRRAALQALLAAALRLEPVYDLFYELRGPGKLPDRRWAAPALAFQGQVGQRRSWPFAGPAPAAAKDREQVVTAPAARRRDSGSRPAGPG